MLSSSFPAKFPIPFANNAGSGYIETIPQASQIAITPGRASLTDGFPPLNFTPVASGGIPPFGKDVNGLEFQITSNVQWLEAGLSWPFDAGFAAAIGGYPLGAVLPQVGNPGYSWISTQENNTNDPDTGGAGWDVLNAAQIQAQTGNWVVDRGTGNPNLLALVLNPLISTVAGFKGVELRIQKGPVPNGGAVSLQFSNGHTALFTAPLTHADGTQLQPAELPANGWFAVIGTGTGFQLIGGNMSAGPAANSSGFAGGQINLYDAVERGPDGLLWGAETLQSTASMSLNAITSFDNTIGSQFLANTISRKSIAKSGVNGALYWLASSVAPSYDGLVLLATLAPDTVNGFTAAAPIYGPLTLSSASQQIINAQIVPLQNETFAIVWAEGTSAPFSLYYEVVDLTLTNIIQNKTLIEQSQSVNFALASLFSYELTNAGGTPAAGFSVVYQQYSNTLLTRLATYTNAGVLVGSIATILTLTAVGTVLFAMALLASGNLAVVVSPGGAVTASEGNYVGVVTPAGANVSALANILGTTDATVVAAPEIAVSPTGFAVVCGVGTWKIGVFGNAGALMGTHTTASALTSSLAKFLKYVSGVFALVWTPAAAGNIMLSVAPVSGTGFQDLIAIAGTSSTAVMHGIGVRNLITGIVGALGATNFFTLSLSSVMGNLVVTVLNAITAFPGGAVGGGSTVINNISAIDGGSWSIFAVVSSTPVSGSAPAALGGYKYAVSQVVGVAEGDTVSAGISVPVVGTAGSAQQCNYIPGPPNVPTVIAGKSGSTIENNMLVISS